jgi:hypothetical protein
MDQQQLRRVCLSVALFWVAASACRPSQEVEPPAEPPPPPEPQILDFPTELHAKDQTVNAFVRQVIETCASGDYDAFRMLWSARDDPFPRDQFHRAWQSVQQVKIVALQPVREPATKELAYAVKAHVELDPSVREPERDVTIVLIRESGHWRLTTSLGDLPDGWFEGQTPSSQPQTTSAPAAPG